MKNFAVLTAVAVLGGSLLASSADAQVRFNVTPDGPNVRVGPDRNRDWDRRDHWDRRDFGHERRIIVRRDRDRWDRSRWDRDVTGSIGNCRTIITREDTPRGTITKRIKRC